MQNKFNCITVKFDRTQHSIYSSKLFVGTWVTINYNLSPKYSPSLSVWNNLVQPTNSEQTLTFKRSISWLTVLKPVWNRSCFSCNQSTQKAMNNFHQEGPCSDFIWSCLVCKAIFIHQMRTTMTEHVMLVLPDQKARLYWYKIYFVAWYVSKHLNYFARTDLQNN